MVIAEAESAIDKIIRKFILLKFRKSGRTWKDVFFIRVYPLYMD